MSQFRVKKVTVRSILNTAAFKLGFESMRAGKPWPEEYDRWNVREQWHFEYGRLFALVVPKGLKIKSGREVTPQAVYEFGKAQREGAWPVALV